MSAITTRSCRAHFTEVSILYAVDASIGASLRLNGYANRRPAAKPMDFIETRRFARMIFSMNTLLSARLLAKIFARYAC